MKQLITTNGGATLRSIPDDHRVVDLSPAEVALLGRGLRVLLDDPLLDRPDMRSVLRLCTKLGYDPDVIVGEPVPPAHECDDWRDGACSVCEALR